MGGSENFYGANYLLPQRHNSPQQPTKTKEKTWLMFGIDCCDVKMKSRYYLKFSTNVFMIES